MKPETKQEQMGATVISLLAVPLALPTYLVERTWRSDQATPTTAILMQIAQDVGVAAVRAIAYMANYNVKRIDWRPTPKR